MLKNLSEKQKLHLIKRVIQDNEPVVRVCAQAGISRVVFYRWLKRYQETGKIIASKTSRLRRGRRVKRELIEKIIALVQVNPGWSSHKISQQLLVGNHGVQNVLKRLRLNTIAQRQIFSQKTKNLTSSQALKSIHRTRINLSSEKRLEMIQRVIRDNESVAHVCREFHISRPTFYKWLKRYYQSTEGLLNRKSKIKHYYRQTPAKFEEMIFSIILKNPEFGVKRIVTALPRAAGKALVGYHGVQRVLERNRLNTHVRRLAYARSQARLPIIAPLINWLKDLQQLIGEIVNISVLPPPKARIYHLARPFLTSLLFSVFFSTVIIFGFRLLFQAPTLNSKLGLLFASIALITGSLFFIYSFKYYLTLAIVLSFSRHSLEEGEGFSFSLTAGFNGKNGNSRLNGNGNGKTVSFFAWLGKIFGVSLDNGNGLTNGNGLKHSGKQAYYNSSVEDSVPTAGGRGGLQPSLDHIELKHRPFVSIHLPFYNEKRVAERLIRACSVMGYLNAKGKANFEIIVCDDSNDETVGIIDKFVAKYRKNNLSAKGRVGYGPVIKVLRRPSRQGFKGAALANALKHTDPRAEFISVFDADFVPYPDTLELFLKYFQVNNQDNIAVVGGYQWHVLNKSENWITR
ncbi:glycosyltransferase, partial [Patescibacteria group bacterium]|nr:glycosyltransferase [Patescibacteria group bacterium]MBU1931355.1 glycosyltransferase [Patescibacteria group bacterium]